MRFFFFLRVKTGPSNFVPPRPRKYSFCPRPPPHTKTDLLLERQRAEKAKKSFREAGSNEGEKNKGWQRCRGGGVKSRGGIR